MRLRISCCKRLKIGKSRLIEVNCYVSSLTLGGTNPGDFPIVSNRENSLEAHRVADNPSPMDRKPYRATVLGLLSGHWGILLFGLAAVGAETGAALLEPWPIKIVLDTVLRAKPLPQWLERAIASMLGTNALGVLEFAVGMVLLIAIVGGRGQLRRKAMRHDLGPARDTRASLPHVHPRAAPVDVVPRQEAYG